MITTEQMVVGDKMIVPYAQVNGSWTIPDSGLEAFYRELQAQKVMPKLFRQARVDDECQFVALLKSPANLATFAFIDSVPVGFAWLNDVRDNHAWAHFGFLKSAWGEDALEFGRMILNYWFQFPSGSGGYLFDLICGHTPTDNRSAIAFIAKLGFIIVGEIPLLYRAAEGRTGAIFSYLTRETFYGLESI